MLKIIKNTAEINTETVESEILIRKQWLKDKSEKETMKNYIFTTSFRSVPVKVILGM